MDEAFGIRFSFAIQAAMVKRNVSPTSLAHMIGRDPSTVRRWAYGETTPNISALKELADALRVKPELFYDPPALPDYPIDEYLLD